MNKVPSNKQYHKVSFESSKSVVILIALIIQKTYHSVKRDHPAKILLVWGKKRT